MPDSFFHSDKKRRRPSARGPPRGRNARTAQTEDKDEDLDSGLSDAGGGEDMDFRAGREDGPLSDEEVVNTHETAAEKRVRLAKGYLAKVKSDLQDAHADQDYDAAEIDRELIASRLQKDVAESSGRIHTFLGSHVAHHRSKVITTPSHCPTAIASSSTSLYISTKRGVIFGYSLASLRRQGTPFGPARKSPAEGQGKVEGHRGEILCLAASEDGKYLVSGGRDKVVGVWDVEGDQAKWLAGMRGHKDAVTAITLPPLNNPSQHILTAALSRHLSLASLSTLSVIDTFFGHQDAITSVSALRPTVAVSSGSRDRTCRWWKVEEETQLVFRGGGRTFEGVKGLVPQARKERLGGGWELETAETGERREKAERDRKGKGREFVEGSIDCVCMLDDQHFVSGGDSGSISLWHTGKKKPVYTQPTAHGIEELSDGNDRSGPRWITSLAALRGTDLFASGSWDGTVRLWAVEPSLRSFHPASHHEIHIPGIINSVQLLSVPSSSIDSSSWPPSRSEEEEEDPIQLPIEMRQAEEDGTAVRPKKEILLVAAVGQEPRLGRWMRIKDSVKNGALVVHIQLDDSGQSLLS